MVVTASTYKSNKQSRVNVQICTEENSVKSIYGIPKYSRGKRLHQMWDCKSEKTRRTAITLGKNYTRDERLIFRNYLLALCYEMAPSGRITLLQPKIIIHRINQVYKNLQKFTD